MVEAAVSVVVAGLAILITLAVVGSMGSQLRSQHQDALGQDNIRVAIDETTRDLRSAGSGTDYANGQSRFLYAGPYTVAFNANLAPDDNDETVECPYCHRAMHEQTLRCPYCENYLSEEDAPSRRKPVWIIVAVGFCLLIVVMWIMRG